MTLLTLAEQPVLLGILFLRPLGMTIIFPLLSSRSLGGALIRNSLILLCLLPAVPALMDNPELVRAYVAAPGVGLIAQEILTGVLIGFVAAIPFWALDSAGYLIDTIRGSSLSSVINPALGEAASVLGILLTQLYTTLFFLNGGFSQLASTLYDSYHLLPPGQDLRLGKAWLALLLSQWSLLSALAVNFALPAVVMMFLVDMALGLINRSAQQLNVFFLAMPVKSVMVILILIVSLGASFEVITNGQAGLFRALDGLLSGMHHE